MITSSFWKDKRVLITGHTGFKGAWLTLWLNQMGARVSGIALEPETQPNAFEALEIEKLCDHHVVDIRDREKLTSTIRKINPEVVFHMAAQALVRSSYTDPMGTYETNVIGTGNVLMALKDLNAVRSVVVITTDKCYENREWTWGYRETDALGGFDPYSSSKACAEILTSSFRRSFFTGDTATSKRRVGLATARAGNVIGGGDWSESRLLPDVIRTIQYGIPLMIRYPDSIRPWQHVLVPLSGYLMLAEKLWSDPEKWSEAFNFAPNDDDCAPVRRLLEEFGNAWGKPVPWTEPKEKQAHEAHFLKLDSSKAKALLGWHPAWELRDAVSASAKWYRTYYENKQRLRELSLAQIASLSTLL